MAFDHAVPRLLEAREREVRRHVVFHVQLLRDVGFAQLAAQAPQARQGQGCARGVGARQHVAVGGQPAALRLFQFSERHAQAAGAGCRGLRAGAAAPHAQGLREAIGQRPEGAGLEGGVGRDPHIELARDGLAQFEKQQGIEAELDQVGLVRDGVRCAVQQRGNACAQVLPDRGDVHGAAALP